MKKPKPPQGASKAEARAVRKPERKPASKPTTKRRERPEEKRARVTAEICAAYAEGEYTLESCCIASGITMRTFYNWRSTDEQVGAAFDRAQAEMRESRFTAMRERALNSFERLITGYDYEETTTTAEVHVLENGTQIAVPSKIVKVKKHVPPNAGMVAMAMRNWHGLRDRLDVNHSGTVTVRQQVMLIGGQEVTF